MDRWEGVSKGGKEKGYPITCMSFVARGTWKVHVPSVIRPDGTHSFLLPAVLPPTAGSGTARLNSKDVLVFSTDSHIVLSPGVHQTTHWCLVDNAQVFLYTREGPPILQLASLTLSPGTQLHILPSPGAPLTFFWYSMVGHGLFRSTFGDNEEEKLLYQKWTEIQTATYALQDADYRLSRFIRSRNQEGFLKNTSATSGPLLQRKAECHQQLSRLLVAWELRVGPGKRVVSFLTATF